MPVRSETGEASATAVESDGGLDVALAGHWQVTTPRPAWTEVLGGRTPPRVRLGIHGVEKWDTSLLLFLFEVQEWCRAAGATCDTSPLPEKIRGLLAQFSSAHQTSAPSDRPLSATAAARASR